jgi:hypothetical protein
MGKRLDPLRPSKMGKDFLAAMRSAVHDMLPQPVCLRLMDAPTVATRIVDAVSFTRAPSSTADAICEDLARDMAIR